MSFKKLFIIFIACLFTTTGSFALTDDFTPAEKEQGMRVTSDTVDFDPKTNTVYAKGNAEVYLIKNKVRVLANEIIYDQNRQKVKAKGNVRIIKSKSTVVGDFMLIDLLKESSLIENPQSDLGVVTIKADVANLYPDNLEALKGQASINIDQNVILSSAKFRRYGLTDEMIERAEKQKKLENIDINEDRPGYKIRAKEIEIRAKGKSNKIIVRRAGVYMGKIKVASIPYFELTADKNFQEIETMLPIVGSNSQAGFYAGPATIFNLPKGTTMKVAPLFTSVTDTELGNARDDSGPGLFARIKNKNHETEILYSDATNNVVMRGEQRLDENWKLRYATNDFLGDGFKGAWLAKYIAELEYRKYHYFPEKGLIYMNRFAFGRMQDYYSNVGTERYKVQGDLLTYRPIWEIGNHTDVRLSAQYDISAYGTGDVHAVGRFGPVARTELGKLSLVNAYYSAAVHSGSPMIFDNYYYGKSNFITGFEYDASKFVTVGYYTSLALLKDNWENKKVTENLVYVKLGPPDIKMCLSVDTARKRTYLGLDLVIGAKKTKFDYDKLIVKDPKKLTNPDSKDDKDKKKRKNTKKFFESEEQRIEYEKMQEEFNQEYGLNHNTI